MEQSKLADSDTTPSAPFYAVIFNSPPYRSIGHCYANLDDARTCHDDLERLGIPSTIVPVGVRAGD